MVNARTVLTIVLFVIAIRGGLLHAQPAIDSTIAGDTTSIGITGLANRAVAALASDGCADVLSVAVQWFGATMCLSRSNANGPYQTGMQSRLVALRAMALTFVQLGSQRGRDGWFENARRRIERTLLGALTPGVGATILGSAAPIARFIRPTPAAMVNYTLNVGALTNLASLVFPGLVRPPSPQGETIQFLLARSFVAANALERTSQSVLAQMPVRNQAVATGGALGAESERLDAETVTMGTALSAAASIARNEHEELLLLHALTQEEQWQLRHVGAPLVVRDAY